MNIISAISQKLALLSTLYFIGLYSICSVSAKDMTFEIRYNNHTNAVIADGDITTDTPAIFSAFIEAVEFDGFKFEIWLNSEGGDLLAGLELGSLIRDLGFMDTVVYSENKPAVCYSSCAYAFLGGRERKVPDQSEIGFHQFFSNTSAHLSYSDMDAALKRSEASTQIWSALVLRYMLDMGANVKLYYLMSLSLPDEMFIPSASDLLELGITTTNEFHQFHLEPYKQGVIAFSKNDTNATGRQVVSQLTTLCDNKQKLILLSAQDGYVGFDANTIMSLNERKPSFTIVVDNEYWEIPFVNLKAYKDTNVLLAITLPKGLAAKITKGQFQGSWTIPAGMGPRMFFQASANAQGQKAIASSFRHCYR